MLRFCLIYSTLFLFISINNAQKSSTGNWMGYILNTPINSKWNFFNEVQYRNYNLIGDTEQLLYRNGIGYNLAENNFNVLIGYVFVNTYKYTNATDKVAVSENRIYQQLITRQSLKRLAIQHNYRIEERFIQDQSMQIRFRYHISATLPLNKPKLEKGALYLSGYNALFINLKSPVYDRNRWYLGLGYALGPNLRLEAGYMHQEQETKHRGQTMLFLYHTIRLD